ncbi:MAG: PAS domain S-box protein [Gammaproteobacteria bacterium]|nr:PAS domain S-box protein [Gammaproteobacteria bacterium]
MARELKSEEYSLLVENSPVMIWRSGLDANCDYFNDTWLSFTGRTLEQELGSGWAEGVHPEDFDRCTCHYLEHFRRREPFEMEYRLRRRDGAYRWIFDRGVPFTDSGTFAGFVGSCVDIDERHRAQEAQRMHSQEQLALARDFEKWILAIVSHDIRNPLNAIQLAARGLRHIADPGGAVGKQADIVTRGVERIQHIAGDLLDLSREREGAGISVDPRPTDLRGACQQVIDELAVVAPDRRITFDCETDSRGMWDEHRILQVISNLTSNAVQHGAPDSPVLLRLAGDDRRVTVEVRNEGTIPREILPRIFEPFSSRRQHERRSEGLGLGLFIAKAIARAHGGELEVDSSEGVTTFRLVLPRRTQLL